MLTIAGGIVLGFFAIIVILAFGEAILIFVGGLLVLTLCLAGLGLAFYLISLVPYAPEVLGGLFLLVIFGLLVLSALVALYSQAKLLFQWVGVLFGLLIVGGLVAAPPVIFHISGRPLSGADEGDMAIWGGLTLMLAGLLAALVAWVSATIPVVQGFSKKITVRFSKKDHC